MELQIQLNIFPVTLTGTPEEIITQLEAIADCYTKRSREYQYLQGKIYSVEKIIEVQN